MYSQHLSQTNSHATNYNILGKTATRGRHACTLTGMKTPKFAKPLSHWITLPMSFLNVYFWRPQAALNAIL